MRHTFEMPLYREPDFTTPALSAAPDARWQAAEADGVAPEGFHSTSMYPEYFKIDGRWTLAPESRMDSSVVLRPDGSLAVVENRNLRKGDLVPWAAPKTGRTAFICTPPDSPTDRLGAATSSFSAGAAAGRPPTPGTTTGSWPFCATRRNTATSSGSWARPSPLTPTPGQPCRL